MDQPIPPQPQIPNLMAQDQMPRKSFLSRHAIPIVIILLAIVAALSTVYFAFSKTQRPQVQPVEHHEKSPAVTNPSTLTAGLYTNDVDHYQFNYPTKWVVSPCDNGLVLINGNCNSEGFGSAQFLTIKNETLANWYEQTPPPQGQAKKITVAGLPADEYDFTIEPADVGEDGPAPAVGSKIRQIYLQHGSDILEIGFTQAPDENFSSQFDQILTSFKFTK
jgi:hypothetical protein